MADSILRLKVESQEYDQKLKRAAEGLNRYIDGCRKVGGTLEVVEKETLDYVRAIGQMETSSRTATGKLSEMKKTFVELSAQYKQMTDAEKQSHVGQALSKSLDELKGRIHEGKAEMDEINSSMGNTGGILNELSSKFGINIKQLSLFGAAVGAAKAGLDVAKDAFMASEANVDEWGRTMDASKSLYEGFLTSLNTGDIGGFLSRIDQIVSAAREAYDEMDRLGTMRTIQSPQISAQQTENERMRMMIQTRRYIAPVDGRKASMTSGQLLTDQQVKDLERMLQNGIANITTLVSNDVKQASKAIESVYRRQGAELGMSVKEFKEGTKSMAEFDKRIEGAQKYRAFEERRKAMVFNSQTGEFEQPNINQRNPYESFKGWDVFRVDGERYNDLVRMIEERDQKALQAYSQQSQAYRAINRAEGISVRGKSGGSSGGSDKGKTTTTSPTYAPDSIAAQSALVSELKKKWTEAGEATRNDYLVQLVAAEAQLKKLNDEQDMLRAHTGGTLLPKSSDFQITNLSNSELINPFSEDNKKAELNIPLKLVLDEASMQAVHEHIQEITGDAKNAQKAFGLAANSVGNVGSALESIDDPATKAAGTILQAIASIALGFAQASQAQDTVGSGWGWIAWLAAGTAALATTISTVHSLTGMAEGGIVKGNSYSGDNIYAGNAMVDVGELVLNRAQQGNLAAQLQDSRPANIGVSRVSGEQIYVALGAYLQRTGRGELVTWK